MSRKHHSAGQRNTAQEVVEFGVASIPVIGHVRLKENAIFGQHLVFQQLFVGPHRAVDAVDGDALHSLSADHSHHISRVFGHLVVLRRADDSGLIEPVQSIYQGVHAPLRQTGNAVGEIFPELFELLLLHLLVVVVVGLEELQHRVLLLFDHLVGFIHRKVELRYQ